MNQSIHVPVMKDEVIDFLLCAQVGGKFLDCTLGGAGHTQAMLDANAGVKVYAVDRDERAIKRAEKKLADYTSRVTLTHANFGSITDVITERDFDGMLVDLGVSTDQLKEARGFSFKDEDSLDMRMDESSGITAHQIVNEYHEKDLIRIFKKGGADKEALSAAKAIVKNRPITSALQLSTIVTDSLAWLQLKKRKSGSSTKTNPATVVLQAIRIEVNKEFDAIEAMLDAAPVMVRQGGRLCVITFHSLEDKLVTKRMRSWAQGDTAPAYLLGGRSRGSKGKFITTQPVLPSQSEIDRNPASRSARLRVFSFGDV